MARMKSHQTPRWARAETGVVHERETDAAGKVHVERARRTPLVINELILTDDHLEASTYALLIQLNTACKTHFIASLGGTGSKTPWTLQTVASS